MLVARLASASLSLLFAELLRRVYDVQAIEGLLLAVTHLM